MKKNPKDTEDDEDFWSCNIDGRGRAIRLIVAGVCLGLAAWLWLGLENTFWSIGLLTAGLLSLYEGLRGWCVLRALGIRTPL